MFYLKVKSYTLNRHGVPMAHVMVKIHPLTLKLKAEITMSDGHRFEIQNQRAQEEEFDIEIERFVYQKYNK